MLLNRRGLRILHETPLAMAVSILGLIYILEIFNPLQGGVDGWSNRRSKTTGTL